MQKKENILLLEKVVKYIYRKLTDSFKLTFYLLSDEDKRRRLVLQKDVKGWVFKWVDTTNDWYDNSKKIIATTDPSLNLPCFLLPS